jgi:hypothetical protein
MTVEVAVEFCFISAASFSISFLRRSVSLRTTCEHTKHDRHSIISSLLGLI